MDELFTNPKLEKAMQLFFYQLLYSDKYPENSILSGIVPLKSPSKNILFVKQPSEEDAYEQIKAGFTELIANMFNDWHLSKPKITTDANIAILQAFVTGRNAAV
jgi:hypothetical protein